MRIKVAPSLLSANFAALSDEIKRVQRAGADLLHIDIMDGHFVPNITIGPVVVKYIRKCTKLPLDVHLMIKNPQKYVDSFVEAGSNMITVHIETITRDEIKKLKLKLARKGIKFGISLNPRTPLNKIIPVLPFADFILVMSVQPGFGGQAFMPVAVGKIRQLRKVFKKDISVDGGINEKSAKLVVGAGANILAAGSYIFGARNPKKAIERIRDVGK
jgi:ribulose-phosphate 3-epimerase